MTIIVIHAMHEKCPYSELVWSVFSHTWTENGISPYSVQMLENTGQKISEYGYLLLSDDISRNY